MKVKLFKIVVNIFAVSALFFACNGNAEQSTGDVNPREGFEDVQSSGSALYGGHEFKEGMKISKEQHKPVVLYFFTTWCRFCRVMDSTVFSDNEVIGTMKSSFVYIRLNTEDKLNEIKYKNHVMSPMEFGLMMGVRGFPTTVFLDKDQRPITKIPGLVKKDVFISILNYINDDCHTKNISFDSYVNGSIKCN